MRTSRRQFLALLGPLALAACGDTTNSPGAEVPDLGTVDLPSLDKPAQGELTAQAKSNNAFAFDLYSRVAKDGDNVAISPFSIATALTMTWAGAKADTESQMRKVLHLEGSRADVLSASGKVAAALQAPDAELELRIANRLFGEKTASFEQPFLDDTKRHFGAPLAPLDFKTSPEPSRVAINQWVEKQTRDRIKDLIPDNALNARTRMVLVNAIYFLADWAEPFENRATYEQPFSVRANESKQVPTMHSVRSAKYGEKDGTKVLSLAYEGSKMSMVMLLPSAVDGVGALERSLSADSFKEYLALAKQTEVDIALPKFEVNPAGSLALSEPLQALGMTDAFDDGRADLTGIAPFATPEQRLYISQVFHKAFVKVDEKGTEAAAATAVIVAEAGAAAPPAPPAQFHADHPFLFFIVDDASGLMLFMGRVVDPAKKS